MKTIIYDTQATYNVESLGLFLNRSTGMTDILL